MEVVGFVDKTAVCTLMAAASYTDIRFGKIYNAVTFSFFAGGLFIRMIAGEAGRIPGILTAAAVTTVVLYPFYRMRGIGAGDIKLFAAASVFLGPAALVQCVCLSFFVGAAVSLAALLRGRGLQSRIHFALPIAVSSCALILFPGIGEQLGRWFGGF